jgi:homoserine O-succinyltransferase
MDPHRAERQDIRPLEIGILNLMPKKEETESQLLRMIGDGPLQIRPTFISLETYQPKNTVPSHLEKFYVPFSIAKKKAYDGFIVTGANIERLPYEHVRYWKELLRILDWISKWTTSKLFLCWGAQAAMYHYHKIEKYPLGKKLFGVFPYSHNHNSELLRGIDDVFSVPVSRHTEVRKKDLLKKGIRVLAESQTAGIALAANKDQSQIFSFGHLEYDRKTIAQEYYRDVENGENIEVPKNYFPNDDPSGIPILSWRANAKTFFQNWINLVYQKTPYQLPVPH